MNSQQPRFQISKDSVNMRSQLSSSLRSSLDLPHVMISIKSQRRVSSPAIASDRAFSGHILIQKHFDLLLAGRAILLKPQPSCTLNRFSTLAGHGSNLHRTDYQGCMGRLRYSSPSVTFGWPTNMRFISLDHTERGSRFSRTIPWRKRCKRNHAVLYWVIPNGRCNWIALIPEIWVAAQYAAQNHSRTGK